MFCCWRRCRRCIWTFQSEIPAIGQTNSYGVCNRRRSWKSITQSNILLVAGAWTLIENDLHFYGGALSRRLHLLEHVLIIWISRPNPTLWTWIVEDSIPFARFWCATLFSTRKYLMSTHTRTQNVMWSKSTGWLIFSLFSHVNFTKTICTV